MMMLMVLMFFLVVLTVLSYFFDVGLVNLFSSSNESNLTKIISDITNFPAIILFFIILPTLTSLFIGKENLVRSLYITVGLSALIAFSLKYLISRDRPEDPLVDIPGSSFPSAHASIVFSSLQVILNFGVWAWIWIFLAVFVGVTRIYLRVHYVSDVLFGSFIGLFVGLIVG